MSSLPKAKVCDKCNKRIPKNAPLLTCSLCNDTKHPKCMRLSKSDSLHIISSGFSWTCYDCLASALPINACHSPVEKPAFGPVFKVKCNSCTGWCYSPKNLRYCNWCGKSIHSKCMKHELGCKTCCESMIPGFNYEPHHLLDDYSHLHDLFFNPYDRENIANEIGNQLDDEQDREYFDEISNILVECRYKEQKHVQNSGANELKLFSLNIRSLIKNIEHLRENIETYCKYDVLCLNETNLIESNMPNGVTDILLEGFHEPLLKDPNRTSGRGGGLAIYINKRVCEFENIEQFIPNLRDVDEITKSAGEFMLVKINNCKGLNKTKLIVDVYRSPSRDPDKFIALLDSVLLTLDRHNRKHIMFAGDFNLDLINHSNNVHCQNLVDTMSKYGFFQLVARPTRVTSHSRTLIDHVYSNDVQHTLSCNVLTVDISDHFATLTTISLGDFSYSPANDRSKTERSQKRDTRAFNAANNLKFYELIDAENWEQITSNMDANEQYDKFNEIYNKHYNTAYPIKSKHVRRMNERKNPKPFILPWLEDACARKNLMYFESTVCPTQKNVATYKKLKKFCEKHINLARDKYHKKYFEEYQYNSKKQWEMINKLLGRKGKQNSKFKLRRDDGNLINSNRDVAEHFNAYFANIATRIKEQISARTTFDPGGHARYLDSQVEESMFISPTDPVEIQRTICTLKNKATQDVKVEPLKIAKDCPKFCEILSNVVNSSFNEGCFPTSLKIAKVVPIHKGGSKLDVKNYRPISLLCTFSKIYEKLMHRRVLDFLERHSTLFEGQYGFRPGRSCEHALLDATNTIRHNLSKKEVSLLLLLDFSKAFDVISHDILLDKLYHYGIRGLAHQWFKSYLSSRSQYVSIGGTNSSSQSMRHGVPQGSILGPLLFIIYINDMPKIKSYAKFVLYADDANIIISGKNHQEILQKMTEFSPLLINWVDQNGLSLNLKKTCYMLLSPNRTSIPDVNIQIAGTTIERKTEARFLGVIVDEKLTWTSHITALKAKMMRYIGIMYKIKSRLPIKVRLQIYQSFVQSHINYCSLIWGFAAKSHIDALFSKQKQGIRAIMPGFVNYYFKEGALPQHTKPFFSEHEILTVHGLIVYNSIILMHKVKNMPQLVPKNISQAFPADIPTKLSDHTSACSWLQLYGKRHFQNSIFYKGPLLSVYADKADVTTLPTLFSINLFKTSAKKMLLTLQTDGDVNEWQPFLLHNVPGLRQSRREI